MIDWICENGEIHLVIRTFLYLRKSTKNGSLLHWLRRSKFSSNNTYGFRKLSIIIAQGTHLYVIKDKYIE